MLRNTPFHEKVASILREEIRRDHEPGDKLAGDRAQAERFDVSVITIGKAMEQLVREGLVRRQQGSGTFVASPAEGERVALLVNDTILDRVAPYFWLTITRRVREKLIEAGFQVEMDLASVEPDDDDGDVRGAIGIRADYDSPSARYFRRRNIPLVGHDLAYEYCVHNDTSGLVQRGVDYLVNRGRRNLAIVATGQTPSSSSNWFIDLFRQTLQGHGLSHREQWTQVVPGEGEGGHIWGGLHEMFEGAGKTPDGLLITDDTLYNEAAMALLSLNVDVPEDLMVVTHANKGSGMFCPFPTTKLENDPDRYAEAMVRMLMELMAGEKPDRAHVMIPFRVEEAGPESGQNAPASTSGTRTSVGSFT